MAHGLVSKKRFYAECKFFWLQFLSKKYFYTEKLVSTINLAKKHIGDRKTRPGSWEKIQ